MLTEKEGLMFDVIRAEVTKNRPARDAAMEKIMAYNAAHEEDKITPADITKFGAKKKKLIAVGVRA